MTVNSEVQDEGAGTQTQYSAKTVSVLNQRDMAPASASDMWLLKGGVREDCR